MTAVYMHGNINVTFVHVPKSAGTSIGVWMKENRNSSYIVEWYDHPNLETMSLVGPRNFTFSVVRNPWERMISFYHFLKNIQSAHPNFSNKQMQWVINSNNQHLDWSTFDKWVDTLDEFIIMPGWEFKPGDPQTYWIKQGVDLIIRYENLENDFKQVQDIFNNYSPLPKRLVGDHSFYREYYNTETKDKIAKRYEEEIDILGYTF